MKVAIVGAGIAGLACAERLREGGADPILFDKGKRPGGRLSTLRIAEGCWDFGAQFVMSGSDSFAAKLADWAAAGVLADWPGGPRGAMVGVPAMASLIELDAARMSARFSVQVQALRRTDRSWSLVCADEVYGPFDCVVLAIPAEQAAPLVSLHDLTLAREVAANRTRPCWTVMAAFDAPLAGLPDAIEGDGPIAWAARNNSKPGRPSRECWVLQADGDWSQRHLEMEASWVAEELLRAFAAAHDVPGALAPTFRKAHRWRFACSQPGRRQPHWNAQLGIGACGDWCIAPQISGAWEAGTQLANQMLRSRQDQLSERTYSGAK